MMHFKFQIREIDGVRLQRPYPVVFIVAKNLADARKKIRRARLVYGVRTYQPKKRSKK